MGATVLGRIGFYENPYYMFSNFSAFAVDYKGRRWMTAEHAYQAAKFTDEVIVQMIFEAPSAHEAKKIAREHSAYKMAGWDKMKLAVMEEIVRAKLYQHEFIQEMLEGTKDIPLIENSPKDTFWGTGLKNDGENHLGKIWMKLREEMRRKGCRV